MASVPFQGIFKDFLASGSDEKFFYPNVRTAGNYLTIE